MSESGMEAGEEAGKACDEGLRKLVVDYFSCLSTMIREI